jgi:YqaJ-like viral recombinase domain
VLTASQLLARAGKLTGSRIAALMRGDAAAVLRLYKEMIGEGEPEDLTGNWHVRLGELTEALNLEWFERKNGPLSRRGEVVVHPVLPWAAVTLDAWCDALKCPVECKHVGGHEPLELIIDRYQPQMQWQMECLMADQCALSVIIGANEPVVEFIPRDPEYASEMVKRGDQFMGFARRREPPVVLPAAVPPVDACRVYDMTGNNQWASQATDWLTTKPAADINRDTSITLKSLVPADAKRCEGHGITISRNRVGHLSLRRTA